MAPTHQAKSSGVEQCLNPSCGSKFGFPPDADEEDVTKGTSATSTSSTSRTSVAKSKPTGRIGGRKRKKKTGTKSSAQVVKHMHETPACNLFSGGLLECRSNGINGCGFKCVAIAGLATHHRFCTKISDLNRHINPFSARKKKDLTEPLSTDFDYDVHEVDNAELNSNFVRQLQETAPPGLYSQYCENINLTTQQTSTSKNLVTTNGELKQNLPQGRIPVQGSNPQGNQSINHSSINHSSAQHVFIEHISLHDLGSDNDVSPSAKASLHLLMEENGYDNYDDDEDETPVIRRSRRSIKLPTKYRNGTGNEFAISTRATNTNSSLKTVTETNSQPQHVPTHQFPGMKITAHCPNGEESETESFSNLSGDEESSEEQDYPRSLDDCEQVDDIEISWRSDDNTDIDISLQAIKRQSNQHNFRPIDISTQPTSHVIDSVLSITTHRQGAQIHPKSYLPYLEMYIKLSRPGIPGFVYDSMKHSIQKNFIPTTNIDEYGNCYDLKAPSGKQLVQWVEKIVHPAENIPRSRSKVTLLQLPSGRNVNIVTNDIKYQISLLLSDEYLMHPDNLIYIDKNNPFIVPENDCPLGEINTGSYYKNATRHLCIRYGNLLLPLIFFIDSTNVTRHGVEPISITLGIFKVIIRNMPKSWFIAGYIEAEKNYSSLKRGQKYSTADKLNDYHHIIDFILKDLTELCDNGGFDFNLKMHQDTFKVTYKPAIQLIIGDCKGADALCGRFGTHSKHLKCLVRDCQVPTKEGDNFNFKCQYHEVETMKNLSSAALQKLSFHKITNAFYKMEFGGDPYGIFLATPSEPLHQVDLGICVYEVEGFIDKLSQKAKDYLDLHVRSLYSNNRRQSHRGFPIMSAMRNGIVKGVPITTGKEKYAKVMVLYLCLMRSDFVKLLMRGPQKRDTLHPFNRASIKEWIHLVEKTLGLREFLRKKEHVRVDFEPKVRPDGNGWIECKCLRLMRKYIRLFKKVIARKKGCELLLTKVHELLHIHMTISRHGSMQNADGSRPEAIGKAIVKDPGSQTQKREETLTRQTASKLLATRNLELFVNFLFRNHHDLYLQFEFLSKATTTSVHADNEEEDDSDNELNLHQPIQHLVLEEVAREMGEQAIEGTDFRLKGTRFTIKYGHPTLRDGTVVEDAAKKMKIAWTSRSARKSMGNSTPWNLFLLAGLEERLFINHRNIGGRIDAMSYVQGYTELVLPSGDVIRAHPKYRSKQQWYSWCMVDWNGLEQPVPARVLMIMDLTHSIIALTENEGINNNLYLRKEPFVLVQSAKIYDSGEDVGKYRFASRLCQRLEMEQKWSLIPASAIVSPAYVVEDPENLEMEGTNGLLKYCFRMCAPTEWSVKGFEWDEQ